MIMLIAIVGFSGIAGDSEWKISIFAGLMGAGFGLINTPLATAVTRVVEPRLLGSALGVNSMSFFIGGSLGTAILLGFSTSDATSSLNPLHDGAASGFSDGFLFLAIPIIAVLLLTSKLPGRAPETEQPHQSRAIHEWRGDCSVGWSPDLELESPTSELSS
jgi:MFS family permease